MKTKGIKIFMLLVLPIFAGITKAQSAKDFFTAVNALDYNAMESMLSNEIDLNIIDNAQFNSKAEAVSRLKTFFSANPVRKMEPLHTGTSKGNTSAYKLAKLITPGGVFRFFVYVETNGGKTWVKEIRIERF
ncbi:MAG: DUF4783 domain-containing protein [Saprospiraceae bacterium]|nr:DUF4783 domain-containing protein [Saprospiraceae bacterium]